MNVPTPLDTRFRDAADREGLLDVAYDLTDSPVGELLVAVTEQGLCRIAYRPDAALDELSATGADALWLMGVWERSPAGRPISSAKPPTLGRTPQE